MKLAIFGEPYSQLKGLPVKPQDWGGWSMKEGKLTVNYTQKPVISPALKPLI